MNPEQEAEFRERMALDGAISEWLTDKLCNGWGLCFAGEDFEFAEEEEAQALGYHRYFQLGTSTETGEPVMVLDDTLLIRRESDGQVFEVEIEVNCSRVVPKDTQLELPVEVTP